jgi:two-component system, cell cycle sensor histidine kinase and response regulator CckA
MNSDYRILMLEDLATDAELVERELRRAGLRFAARRVETREDFLRELEGFAPDLILSDYSLPSFDGLSALRLTLELTPSVPFVVVTASINEETAVECLKAGAADYILKDNLTRLAPAVRSALEKKQAIEEKARAEEALRESEQRLRMALAAGRLVAFEWDVASDRVRRTERRVDVLGLPPAEVVENAAREFFEIVHPEDRPVLRGLLGKLSPENSHYQVEYRITRPDGRVVWLDEQGQASFDRAGGLVRVVGVSADSTARKQAEEALRQSQERLAQAEKMEAVGRLAGGVAHDFNNLLTVIMGFSLLLLNRLEPDHPLRNEVEQIRQAGERAAALTSQLLAFSRRQVIRARVVNLGELVAGLQQMLGQLVGAGVEMVTALQPGAGRVKADPTQLEQIVFNLVVNARDAMPRGGRLTIEVGDVELDEAYARAHPPATPGAYTLLAVSDTGVGMDAATKAHIFEPFFTTKGPGKGTGLGLATVYGIVKQNNGFIWVYSEPEVGTTFKIYLPRYTHPDGEAAAPPAAPPQALPRGAEIVLLVEDEPVVRRLTRELLEMQGYAVLEAAGGEEALEISGRQERIDLLLTDMVMARISGRELADRLRARRPELKVLYMSGYTDDTVVRRGLLERSLAFIQKPFSQELLARKVREVLDGRQPEV